RVTATQRATHLGVQALFLAPAMALCLLLVVGYSFLAAAAFANASWVMDRTVATGQNPDVRDRLLARPDVRADLGPMTYDEAIDRLEVSAEEMRASATLRRDTLNRAELEVLDSVVVPTFDKVPVQQEV